MKTAICMILAGMALQLAMPAPANTPAPRPVEQAAAIQDQNQQYVNPGATTSVVAGCRFTMTLASNPTTGYQWHMEKKPEPTVAILITNVYCPPETKMCGAGGHEKWTFLAKGQGRTTITFAYTRPWEKNIEPALRTTFTVEVQ